MALRKIVSGGQSGVDRAALDAALALDIPCGGWCPRGRRAEDGPLPDEYPLVETPAAHYPQRTEWNVRDSDATLILTRGAPSGGTALTLDIARRLGKPCLVVDLATEPGLDAVLLWLEENHTGVLNVAGPRESHQPGIHGLARKFLLQLLKAERGRQD
ncbi:MAG: putative molybdenum carrier protein [Gammaproteobacteria bacterium]